MHNDRKRISFLIFSYLFTFIDLARFSIIIPIIQRKDNMEMRSLDVPAPWEVATVEASMKV